MVLPQPEERVSVNLGMRVWGMAADGRPFSQNARAGNVSASGALLCDIEHDLKIGDTIAVQAGEKKARCKVVWAANTRSVQKIQVGVQLLSKLNCPWVACLSKTDHEVSSPPGRRKWDRHSIALPISLKNEGALIPIRVTATDVSGSGCYVETLSPFSVGTRLIVELWIGQEKVTTCALVRTSDPRVGMGIDFVGLKTEDQRRFQEYLQAVYPFSRSIDLRGPASK